MKTLKTIALILVILSAIRLGLIGILGIDLVGSLLGSAPVAMSGPDRVICVITGIAGLYSIYVLTRGRDNGLVKM